VVMSILLRIRVSRSREPMSATRQVSRAQS
jgi:hypothetical protein